MNISLFAYLSRFRRRRAVTSVLLSVGPLDDTVSYPGLLFEYRASDIEYKFFSWLAALFGSYDLFHVHWPEFLLRGPSPMGSQVRQFLLRLLLLRLRWQRKPIVRTVHNLQPHEGFLPGEKRLLQRLDADTDLFIYLNESVPFCSPESVLIPHGHYRDCFPLPLTPTSQKGRLLYFGQIRPYKGVDRLLAVFESIPDPQLTLRIVGRPFLEMASVVEAACARDRRIRAHLAYVSDSQLASEIVQAELVVLPLRQMYNSGSILLALSLERPVLAPCTPANQLLEEEVGPGWLYLYGGELTRAVLQAALEQLRHRSPHQPPRFNGRDWPTIGRLHRLAYLRALRSKCLSPGPQ